jgi:hypothetical protein
LADTVGRVVAVWQKLDQDGLPPVRQEAIELVAGKGVVGDRHFGNRKGRQVLLVETGCLDELGLQPGDLREQVTIAFTGLQYLGAGTQLQVGNATVKITGDCPPCRSMARYLGENPKEFVPRAMRKRGMLAVVVEDGRVVDGDVATIVKRTEPLPASDTLD